MRRQALILGLSLLSLTVGVTFPGRSVAQPSQPMAGGMPNLARIVGKPLPDAGMPHGTVSVRVARKMPVNAVADVEVTALIRNAGGDMRKRTAKTDSGGRALFEGSHRATPSKPASKWTARSRVGRAHRPAHRRSQDDADLARQAGGGDEAAGEGEGEASRFTMGATAGTAVPDPSMATGTLEVRPLDETGAPIPNHPVVLGDGGQGQQGRHQKGHHRCLGRGSVCGPAHRRRDRLRRRRRMARDSTRDVPVRHAEDRRGARGGTGPGPDGRDQRDHDWAGARIIVFLNEDRLIIREMLPIENTSDKMFDPGPGAVEIPLPKGHVSTEVNEGERKVEVRKDHGVAVHGAISPRGAMVNTPGHDAGNEIDFMFGLPFDGETREFEQPVPTGIGPFTLITQQVEGHDIRATGPGVGAREERTLNGRKFWVMPVEGVSAGGALRFAIGGLPSTDSTGRNVAGGLTLFLIAAAIFMREARERRVAPAMARAARRTRSEADWWTDARLCSAPSSRSSRKRGRPAPARPPSDASSSSPSSSRFIAVSPPGTSSARHERQPPPAGGWQDLWRPSGPGEREHAVRAGTRGGGAGAERRRQEHAARHPLHLAHPVERRGALGRRVLGRGSALRARIGYVGHDPGLYGDLDGGREPGAVRLLYGADGGPTRVEALLARVGLADAPRDAAVRTFSRGMLQRVALARALAPDPDLLLFDEPSAALDPAGVAWLGPSSPPSATAGRIVVLVTHDLDAAAAVADQVVILRRGRVAHDETRPGGFSAATLRATYEAGT